MIGGGIAGAAAALALRQEGHDVTVYEAHEDPEGDVGAYISLAVNGMRALEKLGCLAEVQSAGFGVPRMRFSTAGGRRLGDVPRHRREADPMHSVTLMRGRLVSIMRRAARAAGAQVITGERLLGMTETVDDVTAEFSSGRRDTAELLVGADGVHSTVRKLIDPSAPRARYSGFYAVAGVSSTPSADGGVWNLTYGRNGAFINITLDERTQWWTAQVADPVRPDLRSIDDDAWKQRLRQLYPETVPSEVLAGTTRLFGSTLMHVCDPIRTWHSTRAVLTGDAAHPVGVAQGAAMAVEDALVVAAALRVAPTIHAALEIYDVERRPRISKLLKHADDSRDSKRPGPVKRRLDVVKMRLMLPFYERATGYLYDYDAAVSGERISA
ncbi:FAD-dependent oxidoreductase [Actinoplanes philippinensis]|uniref:FAD-dependent oxidoreductase n=1 Tax=Actinoplanes philippinensis TaxID=35752 RepID=UPI003405A72C